MPGRWGQPVISSGKPHGLQKTLRGPGTVVRVNLALVRWSRLETFPFFLPLRDQSVTPLGLRLRYIPLSTWQSHSKQAPFFKLAMHCRETTL